MPTDLENTVPEAHTFLDAASSHSKSVVRHSYSAVNTTPVNLAFNNFSLQHLKPSSALSSYPSIPTPPLSSSLTASVSIPHTSLPTQGSFSSSAFVPYKQLAPTMPAETESPDIINYLKSLNNNSTSFSTNSLHCVGTHVSNLPKSAVSSYQLPMSQPTWGLPHTNNHDSQNLSQLLANTIPCDDNYNFLLTTGYSEKSASIGHHVVNNQAAETEYPQNTRVAERDPSQFSSVAENDHVQIDAIAEGDHSQVNRRVEKDCPEANVVAEYDISHSMVSGDNLTPEQRQNREAGMASLRNIHEMFLADAQDSCNMQQIADLRNIAENSQSQINHMADNNHSPSEPISKNSHSCNNRVGQSESDVSSTVSCAKRTAPPAWTNQHASTPPKVAKYTGK